MTKDDFMKMLRADIESNNITQAKNRVGNLAIACKSFDKESAKTFNEVVKEIESKYSVLLEPFNGDPPLASKIKTSYTDSDFADAVFELKQNLCAERLKDVEIIGKTIHGRASAAGERAAGDSSKKSQGRPSRPASRTDRPTASASRPQSRPTQNRPAQSRPTPSGSSRRRSRKSSKNHLPAMLIAAAAIIAVIIIIVQIVKSA